MKRNIKIIFLLISWCCSLFLISACKATSVASQTLPTPTQTNDFIQASPTVKSNTISLDPTSTPFLLPTPINVEMLNNLQPTQQIPISAWKAPLYPIPWAVSAHDHFLFERPISVDYVNWSSDYTYGVKLEEFSLAHTGIDIRAHENSPVLAAGDGIVQWSGHGLNIFGHTDDPYGFAVVIRHDFGYHSKSLYSIYAHLSSLEVESGDIVKTGDIIGKVGETGNATGPHLHFEVRLGENQLYSIQNPLLWISPPIGTGLLVGDIRTTYNIHIPALDADGSTAKGNRVEIRSLETEEKHTYTTYGSTTVIKSDPYYQENIVIPYLAPGIYEITITHWDEDYTQLVEIKAGEITYFKYILDQGFIMHLPELPQATLIPFPTATPTLTPTPTITPTPEK